ncbi:MAG: hypothetical protein ACRD6I_20705, partial [Candidatus Acidiferrales bacterium]
LHVPLGVLGFVAACGGALLWLRGGGHGRPQEAPLPAEGSATLHPRRAEWNPRRVPWLVPLLLLILPLMALAHTPRPEMGLAEAPPEWAFPAALLTQPMPLKPDERAWLTRDGAESADRRRFTWRGMSGSMILISSRSWRAHHRPERCFEVYGLALDASHVHLVRRDFPVRVVSLSDDEGRAHFAATYWFQSATRTTGDYGTRIWADLAPQRDRWVLVSVIFDEPHDPNAPDVAAFYLALHESVQRYLTEA